MQRQQNVETIQEIISGELDTCKESIIQRTIEAGEVASGKTNEGFEVVSSENSGQLLGYEYVGVLEKGRKPGKVPYDFHLIIAKWADAKGISFTDDKAKDRWSRAVAWSIKINGTKMHRDSYEVDIFSTPLQELQTNIAKRVGALFSTEITETIWP